MGCGTSGNVVASAPTNEAAETKMANGKNGTDHHDDDLPTVLLPETPVKAKPPIAYEIPIEEFEGNRKTSTPPPHVQRLLQPPAQEISLPDIEEKLAEAEQRRLMILQQRAASAQKRALKIMKPIETDKIGHGLISDEKRVSNVLTISPQPGVCEDKNI